MKQSSNQGLSREGKERIFIYIMHFNTSVHYVASKLILNSGHCFNKQCGSQSTELNKYQCDSVLVSWLDLNIA